MNELEHAARGANASLLRELWSFMRDNRKWWLFPILVMFLLFSALMLLSSTAAAPFIYTLF